MSEASDPELVLHAVSVVIPVYGGEHHLAAVTKELTQYAAPLTTPNGHTYSVVEVLLVHDCGPDDSARVMRDLAASHNFVRPVWLSRNFGQHAATLAGMASAGGDWIVTMDEDGQHDPGYIAQMLDRAMSTQAAVVYASPTDGSAHGVFRDSTSRWSKRVVRGVSGGTQAPIFHSYRFILGEVGRSVAAYAGSGVYLDVALEWVAGTMVTTPVPMRDEGEDRRSGYSARTLVSHFWRMLLTGGTRPLRMVSVLGCLFAVGGILLAAFLAIRQCSRPRRWQVGPPSRSWCWCAPVSCCSRSE